MDNFNKFQDKYRIPSTRLQQWDYRWAGAYFITICTKERQYFFGDIENDKMNLSPVGELAKKFWVEIENHSQNVKLGEYVIMPNHIHGVLILHEINQNIVETGHDLSLQTNEKNIGQKRFQNIGKNSIFSIIGSYKSAVSKHAHRHGFEFQWQSRYYDHIIRDEISYNKISEYILNNILNWDKDEFFKN